MERAHRCCLLVLLMLMDERGQVWFVTKGLAAVQERLRKDMN